jgi:hypothetical protein
MSAVRVLGLVVALTAAGCASRSVESTGPPKGPHGGLLLDWGERRGEFLIDHDRQEAVVHVLDGAGKPSPLALKQVVLTLSRPAARITLEARPDDGDPPGRASRFVGRMPVPTRGRKFAGTVSVVIDGRTQRGEFDQQQDYALRGR